MLGNMLEYYKMIKQNNINIIYSGPIWSDGLEGIGTTLRKRLEFDEMPLSASQAVFSVFVEQMNNMLHYSSDHGAATRVDAGTRTDVGNGIFIMGSLDKKYFIQTGNMMNREEKDLVAQRIDHLNTMDKAQMRQYYKERIKAENENPLSKGAGLGLIEIARRSSSKIEYQFDEIDGEQLFFTMYVTIG